MNNHRLINLQWVKKASDEIKAQHLGASLNQVGSRQ